MTATAALAVLTPQAAHRAVGAAIARAEALGVAVVACVVDATGQTLAMLRMTRAPFHSNAIARDKAFTAMSFRQPTDALGAALAERPVLRDGIAGQPGTILFAGGLPIEHGGEIVGAIGVSGASEDQDREIADAGRLMATGQGAPVGPAGESA